MSNLPIKDVKSCFLSNMSAVTKSQTAPGTESFSNVFQKSQKSQEQEISNTSLSNKGKSEKTEGDAYRDSMESSRASERLNKKTEDVMSTSKKQSAQEAAEEAGITMVEKTAETFGVSVEEVEAAMELLGLTALDLLNPENLTGLVLALNSEVDALSLVTDEQLFMELKQLMNTAGQLTKQLQEQFQLSEGDFSKLISEIKEQFTGEDLIAQPTEEAVQVAVDEEHSFTKEAERTETIQLTKDRPEQQSVNSDHSLEASAALKTEETESGRNTSHQEDSGNMARQSFSQNLMNQLAEAVEKAQGSQTTYSGSGQEIINQITDYIKLHVKPQTTEMELQLHPASLGNVKVQIASTEGVLTATFTTQNEAVKAALEAQLIQLKDNFAQQGLKVESIEVNVQTQGFERSLDQQNQQNSQNEEKNKRSGRRIRLEGLGALEDISLEEMPEEDKVVADMMIRNGNSVDYTV